MMSYHEAVAAGEVAEYVGSVGISSWDDDGWDREHAGYNSDDDGCRCRTYTITSSGGDGYGGGTCTETDGCPVHDPDLTDERFVRRDVDFVGSIGMCHDYGMYCGCSECLGEVS